MRLFLSSYRAGNYPDKLADLFGKTKVAVISNAKDYKSPGERKESMDELLAFFKDIGVKAEELDLRLYFNSPETLQKQLDKYQSFWLAGGNAFLLRRALKYTGLDKFLIERVQSNSIIYGGESAGAIMAAPTLKGSEDKSGNEDHPNFITKGYDKKVLWDGLGLVTYIPVPHFKSPNYDLAMSINGYIEYLKKHKLPYKIMEEHQAIVINGDKEELLK
jgi:dipeptidase E